MTRWIASSCGAVSQNTPQQHNTTQHNTPQHTTTQTTTHTPHTTHHTTHTPRRRKQNRAGNICGRVRQNRIPGATTGRTNPPLTARAFFFRRFGPSNESIVCCCCCCCCAGDTNSSLSATTYRDGSHREKRNDESGGAQYGYTNGSETRPCAFARTMSASRTRPRCRRIGACRDSRKPSASGSPSW